VRPLSIATELIASARLEAESWLDCANAEERMSVSVAARMPSRESLFIHLSSNNAETHKRIGPQ
jgi:hypothetical protein